MGKYAVDVCILLCILVAIIQTVDSSLGFNWGTISYMPLPPKAVLSILQKNDIKMVKLFDANNDILTKLAGTGIEVMVMVKNEELSLMAYSQDNANNWVKTNVKPYLYEGGTQITYVAIGNEAYLPDLKGIYLDQVPAAMQSILNALEKYGLARQVQVVTPMNFNIVVNSDFPSGGEFDPTVALQMSRIIQLLEQQGAPYVVNIYPFLTAYFEKVNNNVDFDPEFLFFGGNGGTQAFTDPITKIRYTNIFVASYDKLAVAVDAMSSKKGAVKIMLGEIGWPTDGSGNTTLANIPMAQRFNNEAIQYFLSNKGTPMRNGSQIGGWLFGLLDEDAKPTTGIGYYERHWGIFNYDGTPKYNLDLKGKNDSKAVLKSAGGVYFKDKVFCIANANATDAELRNAVDFACSKADCTSIQKGSSCYDTTNKGSTQLRNHVNYAMNNYFQENDQEEIACSFNGTAVITTIDPTYKKDCPFRVALAIARITGDLKVGQSWGGSIPMLLLLLLLCLIVSTGK